jgi:hypothetical protein
LYWPRGEHIYVAVAVAMGLFVAFSHRINIGRLLRGEESRIGDKVSLAGRESPSDDEEEDLSHGGE